MLTSRLKGTTTALAQQLSGRPFTEAKTRNEALKWWTAHRHDQYGAKAVRLMQPVTIAELDMALNQYVNEPMIGGQHDG